MGSLETINKNSIKLNNFEKMYIEDKTHGELKESKFKNIFIQYTGVSPIHGFHHFGEEKNFKKLEIFLWIMIFAISFGLCSFMIFNLWDKWDNNPLVVTFDNTFKHVREIPVPAVTICSGTKAKIETVNILKNLKIMKNNESLATDQ